jgi:hypothetical protein
LRPYALIACLFLLLPDQASASGSLQARLEVMASRAETVLHYEETRQSDLLDEPVIVRGRLEYDPNEGRLTKWVDEPKPGRLAITPTHLEAQSGNGRTRRLPLERRPEFAALLGGIRALLAGDAAALEAAFVGEYGESADGAWTLSLAPRSETVRRRLERIDIAGHGDRLATIETVLANGRRERLNILPAPGDDDAP